MGSIRSTWVNRLRGECCYDVFGPELGREIKENRATSEALCKFIGGRTQGSQVIYQQNGPFLFPDPPTPKDLENRDWRAVNIFRNPLLMRVSLQLSIPSYLKLSRDVGREMYLIWSKVYCTRWARQQQGLRNAVGCN
jgi:hypothetical protein